MLAKVKNAARQDWYILSLDSLYMHGQRIWDTFYIKLTIERAYLKKFRVVQNWVSEHSVSSVPAFLCFLI